MYIKQTKYQRQLLKNHALTFCQISNRVFRYTDFLADELGTAAVACIPFPLVVLGTGELSFIDLERIFFSYSFRSQKRQLPNLVASKSLKIALKYTDFYLVFSCYSLLENLSEFTNSDKMPPPLLLGALQFIYSGQTHSINTTKS